MHTYRQTGPSEFTVGYERFARNDSWHAIRAFPTEARAAAYVAFLNGGNPAPMLDRERAAEEPELPLDQQSRNS